MNNYLNGGLLQLYSKGKEDNIMLNNPDITFFKYAYKSPSAFYKDEIVNQDINLKWNETYIMKIPKDIHYLGPIWLKVNIPYFQLIENITKITLTKTNSAQINEIIYDNISTYLFNINGEFILIPEIFLTTFTQLYNQHFIDIKFTDIKQFFINTDVDIIPLNSTIKMIVLDSNKIHSIIALLCSQGNSFNRVTLTNIINGPDYMKQNILSQNSFDLYMSTIIENNLIDKYYDINKFEDNIDIFKLMVDEIKYYYKYENLADQSSLLDLAVAYKYYGINYTDAILKNTINTNALLLQYLLLSLNPHLHNTYTFYKKYTTITDQTTYEFNLTNDCLSTISLITSYYASHYIVKLSTLNLPFKLAPGMILQTSTGKTVIYEIIDTVTGKLTVTDTDTITSTELVILKINALTLIPEISFTLMDFNLVDYNNLNIKSVQSSYPIYIININYINSLLPFNLTESMILKTVDGKSVTYKINTFTKQHTLTVTDDSPNPIINLNVLSILISINENTKLTSSLLINDTNLNTEWETNITTFMYNLSYNSELDIYLFDDIKKNYYLKEDFIKNLFTVFDVNNNDIVNLWIELKTIEDRYQQQNTEIGFNTLDTFLFNKSIVTNSYKYIQSIQDYPQDFGNIYAVCLNQFIDNIVNKYFYENQFLVWFYNKINALIYSRYTRISNIANINAGNLLFYYNIDLKEYITKEQIKNYLIELFNMTSVICYIDMPLAVPNILTLTDINNHLNVNTTDCFQELKIIGKYTTAYTIVDNLVKINYTIIPNYNINNLLDGLTIFQILSSVNTVKINVNSYTYDGVFISLELNSTDLTIIQSSDTIEVYETRITSIPYIKIADVIISDLPTNATSISQELGDNYTVTSNQVLGVGIEKFVAFNQFTDDVNILIQSNTLIIIKYTRTDAVTLQDVITVVYPTYDSTTKLLTTPLGATPLDTNYITCKSIEAIFITQKLTPISNIIVYGPLVNKFIDYNRFTTDIVLTANTQVILIYTKTNIETGQSTTKTVYCTVNAFNILISNQLDINYKNYNQINAVIINLETSPITINNTNIIKPIASTYPYIELPKSSALYTENATKLIDINTIKIKDTDISVRIVPGPNPAILYLYCYDTSIFTGTSIILTIMDNSYLPNLFNFTSLNTVSSTMDYMIQKPFIIQLTSNQPVYCMANIPITLNQELYVNNKLVQTLYKLNGDQLIRGTQLYSTHYYNGLLHNINDSNTIKETIYDLYESQYTGVYTTVVDMIESSQDEYAKSYNEVLNNIKKSTLYGSTIQTLYNAITSRNIFKYGANKTTSTYLLNLDSFNLTNYDIYTNLAFSLYKLTTVNEQDVVQDLTIIVALANKHNISIKKVVNSPWLAYNPSFKLSQTIINLLSSYSTYAQRQLGNIDDNASLLEIVNPSNFTQEFCKEYIMRDKYLKLVYNVEPLKIDLCYTNPWKNFLANTKSDLVSVEWTKNNIDCTIKDNNIFGAVENYTKRPIYNTTVPKPVTEFKIIGPIRFINNKLELNSTLPLNIKYIVTDDNDIIDIDQPYQNIVTNGVYYNSYALTLGTNTATSILSRLNVNLYYYQVIFWTQPTLANGEYFIQINNILGYAKYSNNILELLLNQPNIINTSTQISFTLLGAALVPTDVFNYIVNNNIVPAGFTSTTTITLSGFKSTTVSLMYNYISNIDITFADYILKNDALNYLSYTKKFNILDRTLFQLSTILTTISIDIIECTKTLLPPLYLNTLTIFESDIDWINKSTSWLYIEQLNQKIQIKDIDNMELIQNGNYLAYLYDDNIEPVIPFHPDIYMSVASNVYHNYDEMANGTIGNYTILQPTNKKIVSPLNTWVYIDNVKIETQSITSTSLLQYTHFITIESNGLIRYNKKINTSIIRVDLLYDFGIVDADIFVYPYEPIYINIQLACVIDGNLAYIYTDYNNIQRNEIIIVSGVVIRIDVWRVTSGAYVGTVLNQSTDLANNINGYFSLGILSNYYERYNILNNSTRDLHDNLLYGEVNPTVKIGDIILTDKQMAIHSAADNLTNKYVFRFTSGSNITFARFNNIWYYDDSKLKLRVNMFIVFNNTIHTITTVNNFIVVFTPDIVVADKTKITCYIPSQPFITTTTTPSGKMTNGWIETNNNSVITYNLMVNSVIAPLYTFNPANITRIYDLDKLSIANDFNNFNDATLNDTNKSIPTSIRCTINVNEPLAYFTNPLWNFTNLSYCYYQYILVDNLWFRVVDITPTKLYINLASNLTTPKAEYKLIFSAANINKVTIMSNNHILHNGYVADYPRILSTVNSMVLLLSSPLENNLSFILTDVSASGTNIDSNQLSAISKLPEYSNMNKTFYYENYIPILIDENNVFTKLSLELKQDTNILLYEITEDANQYIHYIDIILKNGMFFISSKNNFHNVNTSTFYLYNIIPIVISSYGYITLLKMDCKIIKELNTLQQNTINATVYLKTNAIGSPNFTNKNWVYRINLTTEQYNILKYSQVYYGNNKECTITNTDGLFLLITNEIINNLTHIYIKQVHYIEKTSIISKIIKPEYTMDIADILPISGEGPDYSVKLVNRINISSQNISNTSNQIEYTCTIKGRDGNNVIFEDLDSNYLGDNNEIITYSINLQNEYLIQPTYNISILTPLFNICKNYTRNTPPYIVIKPELSISLPSLETYLNNIDINNIIVQDKPWKDWSIISFRNNANFTIIQNSSIQYNGNVFQLIASANSCFTTGEIDRLKIPIQLLFQSNNNVILTELHLVEQFLLTQLVLFIKQEYFWKNINIIVKDIVESYPETNNLKWTFINNTIVSISNNILETVSHPTNFTNGVRIMYLPREYTFIKANELLTVSRNPTVIDGELNGIGNGIDNTLNGCMMDRIIAICNTTAIDKKNIITTKPIYYKYMDSLKYYIAKQYIDFISTNENKLNVLTTLNRVIEPTIYYGRYYDYLFNEKYFGLASNTKYVDFNPSDLIDILYLFPLKRNKLVDTSIIDETDVNTLVTNNIFSYTLSIDNDKLRTTELNNPDNKYTIDILDNNMHDISPVIDDTTLSYNLDKMVDPQDIMISVEEQYSVQTRTELGTLYTITTNGTITVDDKIECNDTLITLIDSINNNVASLITLNNTMSFKLTYSVAIISSVITNNKTVLTFSSNYNNIPVQYIEIDSILYLITNNTIDYIEPINLSIVYNLVRFVNIITSSALKSNICDIKLDRNINPYNYTVPSETVLPFRFFKFNNNVSQYKLIGLDSIRIFYNGVNISTVTHTYKMKQSIPYDIRLIQTQSAATFYYKMQNIELLDIVYSVNDIITFGDKYTGFIYGINATTTIFFLEVDIASFDLYVETLIIKDQFTNELKLTAIKPPLSKLSESYNYYYQMQKTANVGDIIIFTNGASTYSGKVVEINGVNIVFNIDNDIRIEILSELSFTINGVANTKQNIILYLSNNYKYFYSIPNIANLTYKSGDGITFATTPQVTGTIYSIGTTTIFYLLENKTPAALNVVGLTINTIIIPQPHVITSLQATFFYTYKFPTVSLLNGLIYDTTSQIKFNDENYIGAIIEKNNSITIFRLTEYIQPTVLNNFAMKIEINENLVLNINHIIEELLNSKGFYYEMPNLINLYNIGDGITFTNENIVYTGVIFLKSTVTTTFILSKSIVNTIENLLTEKVLIQELNKMALTINNTTTNSPNVTKSLDDGTKFFYQIPTASLLSAPDDFIIFNGISNGVNTSITGVIYNKNDSNTIFFLSTNQLISTLNSMTFNIVSLLNNKILATILFPQVIKLQGTLYNIITNKSSFVESDSTIYTPIIQILKNDMTEFTSKYYYTFQSNINFTGNIYIVVNDIFILGEVIMNQVIPAIKEYSIVVGTNIILDTLTNLTIYDFNLNLSTVKSLTNGKYIYQKGTMLKKINNLNETVYEMLFPTEMLYQYNINFNSTNSLVILTFKYTNMIFNNISFPNVGFNKIQDIITSTPTLTTSIKEIEWVDMMQLKLFKSIQLTIDNNIIENIDYDTYIIYLNYIINQYKKDDFNNMIKFKFDSNNNIYFYLPLIFSFSYLPIKKMNRSNIIVKLNTSKLTDLMVSTGLFTKNVTPTIDINYSQLIVNDSNTSYLSNTSDFVLLKCLYSYQNFILNNSEENIHLALSNRTIDLFFRTINTTTTTNSFDRWFSEYKSSNTADAAILRQVNNEKISNSTRYDRLSKCSGIVDPEFAIYLDEKYLQYIPENLNDATLIYSNKISILTLYFSTIYSNKVNIQKNSTIKELCIKINGIDVIPILPSSYYNLVIPYLKGYILPDEYYMYSFAYNSLEKQPNGMLNLKYVKDLQLNTKQNVINKDVKLKICTQEYRIIKIENNVGKLV